MLFKNLFVSSIIIASSVAALAAPPAAGSVTDHISKIKDFIKSVHDMYANDLKPHLKSIVSNPHIVGCALFQKEQCEKFESTLKEDDRAVIQKMAEAFQSKVSKAVHDNQVAMGRRGVLTNVFAIVGVAFSALTALLVIEHPFSDIGDAILIHVADVVKHYPF